ncbi:hypothetical protein D0864_12597 [Hortaea werneckii]|uniref:DUF6536 domain-containing protein n=1 Tax=Hortaea werneckii TaxID=91943 RepID=A0A3M7DH80_HORWE|nr:hypothetical protein D0864_12597 [Hortaea werneckii]
MAAFTFNPSPLHRPGMIGNVESNEYELQPSSLPRSRAPSYASKSNFRNSEEQADEALLPRKRWTFPEGTEFIRTITQAMPETAETSAGTSNRKKRRMLQGWRFGVAVSALTAFTVLLLNMILTIYAGVKFGSSGGVGTAFDGDCERVNVWTTGLHVRINGLSSILLSASNYTMQCLSSPTRAEIDRAHARGDWLDVGVVSVRNLWRINWRRTVIWWILALSSVPIHFLYNSVIFKTIAANEYIVLVTNRDFLQGKSFAPFYQQEQTITLSDGYASAIRDVQLDFSQGNNYANDTRVHNLTASECMTAYGTTFVSEHRNVLAITSAQGNQTNNTILYADWPSINLNNGFESVPYGWICLDAQGQSQSNDVTECDIVSARKNASSWTINDYKIEFCLAQVAQPHCKLQFSLPILATVIVMNACKSICMFWTLWRHSSATLVTIGDALSSFLDQPDEHTRGRCLTGKSHLKRGPLHWRENLWYGTKPNTDLKPVTFRAPLRRRWFAAASVTQWCTTIGLCLGVLIAATYLLTLGLRRWVSNTSASIAFKSSFGAVDSRALLDIDLDPLGSKGLILSVLLANLPQAIVSLIYVIYNGLLTCMCLAHEYSKYGLVDRKKTLRVTTPHGQQRSTYYLQLPFRYGAPLLVASATLHWLISQSLFLARISSTDYKGQNDGSEDRSEVGYSCLPILLAMCLGAVMVVAALGCGFRKFASHIPVAGSCSVALAAAAHRPKDDVDAAFLPVQWGEVRSEGTDEVGHCCFTRQEVHDLTPGRQYAGTARKP